MDVTLATYHVPAWKRHWMFIRPDGSYAQQYGPHGGGLFVVSYVSSYADDTHLDSLAKAALGSNAPDWPRTSLRRLSDRTVDGRVGYVISAHSKYGWYWEYGTAVGHDWPTFSFEAPADNAKAHQMMDAVLASVKWKQ